MKCLLLIWSSPSNCFQDILWIVDFHFCSPPGLARSPQRKSQFIIHSDFTLTFFISNPFFLLSLPHNIPSHLGVSHPIPSCSPGVLGGSMLQVRGSCLWVSQCTAGWCDGWTCWAAHYCCHWSSLLVIIPACHQSWHPLQTSQGGWKLNRGSLPCLWPKETCVCVFKNRICTVEYSTFILGVEGTHGCD